MNLDDGIPFAFFHVDKHAVAKNTCVVDHDVELAKVLDRAVNHMLGLFPFRDVVTVCNGLATGSFDFVCHLLRGRSVSPQAFSGYPQVIDNDLGAAGSQCKAYSRPIPRAAPVTIATRPSHKRLMIDWAP